MTELTNEEMARYVVEHTGGCWHKRDEWNPYQRYCSKCKCPDANPAFTDDAGKVELIRVMKKCRSFVLYRLVPVDYLTDTTGKLLRAAYVFLKEIKK